MKNVRAWLKRISQLGAVCFQCKMSNHCGGCSCCMQRP